jgi:hypothetical protein
VFGGVEVDSTSTHGDDVKYRRRGVEEPGHESVCPARRSVTAFQRGSVKCSVAIRKIA